MSRAFRFDWSASMMESSFDFFISSASEMSARAVPSTPLKRRVSSTSSSLASSTTSPRTSVLDQISAPAFSRDGILGKAGEIWTLQQPGPQYWSSPWYLLSRELGFWARLPSLTMQKQGEKSSVLVSF